jgi:hypothetical protein
MKEILILFNNVCKINIFKNIAKNNYKQYKNLLLLKDIYT